MRPGGAAGAAEEADLGLRRDALADRYRGAVQMCIARGDAVAVVDLDDLAVIVAVAGEGHHPGRRGIDRRHVGRQEIDPGMQRGAAVDRIAPHPEPAADVIAGEWRRHRQRPDQVLQRRELFRAHRGLGMGAARRRDERTALAGAHAVLREETTDIDAGRGEDPLELCQPAGARRRGGSGWSRRDDDGDLGRRLLR